jgi:hypothetical protein
MMCLLLVPVLVVGTVAVIVAAWMLVGWWRDRKMIRTMIR